ncbi:MAG: PQQ-like beta-propeller repeat protein, partial [Planctomycetales bacterium]
MVGLGSSVGLADEIILPHGQARQPGGGQIGQANLDIDQHYQDQLARAARYVKNQRYDLAVLVWQKMLDETSDELTTMADWQYTFEGSGYRWYRPLRLQIEQTIAELPAVGLQVYRDHVDAQARKLFETPAADRELNLAKIARHYFLSSFGDDAALELASRALDREEFTNAVRLLSKIKFYPDTQLPQHAIAIRLAVASAFLGDHETSQQVMAAADQQIRESIPLRIQDLLAKELGSLKGQRVLPRSNQMLPMLTSTIERRGGMSPFSWDASRHRYHESWFDEFYHDPASQVGVETGSTAANFILEAPLQPSQNKSHRAIPKKSWMLQQWRSRELRPAAQLVLHEDRVYFKTNNQVRCRESASGRLKWFSDETVYPSVSTGINRGMRVPGRRDMLRYQLVPRESQFFLDRINQSMTLISDTLFTLKPIKRVPGKEITRQLFQGRVVHGAIVQGGNTIQLPRTNQLVAYDTRPVDFQRGPKQPLWTVSVDDTQAGCFLAAPVESPTGLLVPVFREHALWLVSLDAENGERLWATRLCNLPSTGRSTWSPVGVSVEGSTAYVATGAGVIVAV